MSSNSYRDLIQSGLAADKPASPENTGLLQVYYATDTGAYYLWTGDAWVVIGSSSGLQTVTRNANVAAAGSTVADAAQLSAGFTVVTGADGNKGVVLPATPAAGTVVIVKNVDAANAILKVYPDAAATVNAIATHGALSMAAKTSAVFIADSTTQWYTVPLLPS